MFCSILRALPANLSLIFSFAALHVVATEIRLIVTPPAETPAGATLYLAGNHPSLGPWKADAQELTKSEDGTWTTTLKIPSGFPLEYKLTLGSWETVEKTGDGSDIPNRTATVAEGLVLHVDVESWGSESSRRKLQSTLVGNTQFIENFPSDVLDNERNLIIYLPPQYDQQPEQRFPVLYMQDGQNLFDEATSAFGVEWQADEAAESLIAAGKIEPLIIVGIYTEANRTDELTDIRSEKYQAGGKAPLYARFLLEELKPFIDKTYRTKPDRLNTAVGGSSLGGYISLWLCEKYPEMFGKCAAVSPAVLWNDGSLVKRWTDESAQLPLQNTRFWLDVGTKEAVRDMPAGAYVEAVQKVANSLEMLGADYQFVIEEGADHNETAWQKRFPEVLEFLFPRVK